MSEIYCSIDSCNYWSQGNKCAANEIMVTSDQYASQAPDTMDAPDHAQFPQMHVETCMETCCKSFVHKGSPHVGVDGVTRNS